MIAAGCDTIVVCGGDGTVNETMQQMVEQQASAALSVIPLGTGNALATDLGISRNPIRAARAMLEFAPRRIAVGRMEFLGAVPRARYFVVTAGVGGDAHLLYHLNFEFKRRYGMLAYYGRAFGMLASHDFPPFVTEFRENGQQRSVLASQLMGVRIRFFPWPVNELAPGASLERNDLRLVLFKTPRALAFLSYVTARVCGFRYVPKEVELVHATEVICRPAGEDVEISPKWRDEVRTDRIYAEADGEPVGRIPVRISTVPDALTLLAPQTRS